MKTSKSEAFSVLWLWNWMLKIIFLHYLQRLCHFQGFSNAWKCNIYWWLVKVTLVVAFGFLRQKLWRWWGSTNGILSFYKCKFSGGVTMRWWEHLNPIICKRIWTFWTDRWWGCKKLWAQALVPGLERSCPIANIVELSQHLIFFLCIRYQKVKCPHVARLSLLMCVIMY